MRMKKQVYSLIAGILTLITLQPIPLLAVPSDVELWATRLRKLADWQVDLTSEIGLIQNAEFLSWRQGITLEDAKLLIRMIQTEKISGLQAVLAILICTGLNEKDFMTVMEELIQNSTGDDVLLRIIRPYYPYGPGLAHAAKRDGLIEKLRKIRDHEILSVQTRKAVDEVLSGVAAKNYSKFERNPRLFGFDKESVRLLKRKKPE